MLIENIKMAFASMAANKLRTFLTMLGIIIGIAAVIAIMTVGNSMTRENQEQMSMFGINVMDVNIWLADKVEVDENTNTEDLIPEFPEDMMKKMVTRYSDEIEAVSVTSWLNGNRATLPDSTNEKQYANIQVQGVNPGFFTVQKANYPIIEGRIFSKNELAEDDYDCVVSDRLVNNLFNGDTKAALGKKIDVSVNDSTYTYTIVGVYRDAMSGMEGMGGAALSEQDITTMLFIPYQNGLALTDDPYAKRLQSFEISATPGTDVISFTTELQDYLQSLLPEDTKYQVSVYNNQQWIEDSNKAMEQMTLAITAIGAIALLVGGIGVMNIMTVSITERTREIGTRKALGAPRRAIRGQFITEAVIMSVTGGMIGIVAGLLIGLGACHLISMKMYISWQSILISFLFSFVIGVFFGFYPANKASKMDPIDALRYE